MAIKSNHTTILFVTLFAVCFAARLSSEVLTNALSYSNIQTWEFRGILSDAVLCFIVAFLLGKTRHSFWKHPIYFLWAGLYAGNLSHVEANSANIDFSNIPFIMQGEFVTGSIFSVELLSRWLSLWLVSLLLHYVLCRIFSYKSKASGKKYPLTVLASVMLLGYVPAEGEHWREYNLFEENIRKITIFPGQARAMASPHRVAAVYQRMTALDLNGKRIISKPSTKQPNILIITMEGLSDYYISQGAMPYLESLAKRSIYYPNFINMQQYTFNGLYAILCGDHSSLENKNAIGRTNKWFATISHGPRLPCLPALLKKRGYYSAFFQASGLHFTRKKHFFKRIGFDLAHSAKMLHQQYDGKKNNVPLRETYLGWGMPDKEFLNLASNKVLEYKNSAKSPWFVSLMTTGTHWPYGVTNDQAKRFGSRRNAAFNRADQALEKLLKKLEIAGVLKNTLVFILGDEAHMRRNRKNEYSTMAANWGLLVVLTPNQDTYTSRDYFTQADIKTSILDYLEGDLTHARYRSVFREYNRFRPLMFSAGHGGRWIAVPEPGRFIKCKTNFTKCRSRYYKGELFEAEMMEGAPEDDVRLYIDVARKSDAFLPKKASQWEGITRRRRVRRKGIRRKERIPEW